MRPVRFTTYAATVICLLLAVAVVYPDSPSARVRNASCTRYASPRGSDWRGHGTRHRPFRTLRRLDEALQPGQTGCLLSGSYGDVQTWNPLAASGRPSARIVIRAAPGQGVTIRGWIEMIGSYTTVEHLRIDGSNTFLTDAPNGCPTGVSVGLSLEGRGDVLQYDDIFQSVKALRGSGIGIGWSGSGDDAVVRFNRIHDVGQCGDFDQVLYLAHGRGARIYDNWMWNDAHGWGVQIYPGASGAMIFANVIDHVASGFAVGGSSATSNNRIFHNVVLRSTGLDIPDANIRLARGVSVSDTWSARAGVANVFAENDSWRNRGGLAMVRAVRLFRNIRVNPLFEGAARHDYRLRPRSLLRNWGLWGG
jgi:hypothetical protein